MSTSSNPAAANPATSNPASSNPATSNPATSNPATSNPATSNPATSNPATSNPATSNPATSNVFPTRLPAQLAGLVLAGGIGAAATLAGSAWPVLGAPVMAVVLGASLSAPAGRWGATLGPGLAVARTRVLQLAVVLLGVQLSLAEVARVGISSLPVMLGTLAVCLALARLIGRRLGVGADLRTLIGVGTGICGASAIAAVSPTIRARNPDIAYAISTTFLFNVLAVLAFPPLGHALGLGQQQFGLFAGTAVNDTSSVVAAAASYGPAAADHAIVVKLVRTLMIIPITLVLAALVRRRERADGPGRVAAGGGPGPVLRLVPWFLVGFLVAVTANSTHLVPAAAQGPVRQLAALFIAVALAAIGLCTDVRALARTGPRPLLLGFVLWVAVSATSLGLQAMT